MRDSVLFMELGIDATNDEILDQMRIMKSSPEDGSYCHVVCAVRGFAGDERPPLRDSRWGGILSAGREPPVRSRRDRGG
jgi:hypothetical protein